MTKLIQSSVTGMFLTAKGDWTKDVASARRFADQEQAAALARKVSLTHVRFYYSFDDYLVTEWDFTVPLRDDPDRRLPPGAAA